MISSSIIPNTLFDTPPQFINRKPTILCFEESPRLMRMVMWLLSKDEYEIIWAKSAEELLKLAKFYQPKLILVDEMQQMQISKAFINQINDFVMELSFPEKILLVVDDNSMSSRLVERVTAVPIEQLSMNQLAKWLNQFKQNSVSENQSIICE